MILNTGRNRIFGERIAMPDFEMVSCPTVGIVDIGRRRFNIIEEHDRIEPVAAMETLRCGRIAHLWGAETIISRGAPDFDDEGGVSMRILDTRRRAEERREAEAAERELREYEEWLSGARSTSMPTCGELASLWGGMGNASDRAVAGAPPSGAAPAGTSTMLPREIEEMVAQLRAQLGLDPKEEGR